MWVVGCPSILGCVSQGSTKNEVLESVKDAVAACLAVRSERGMQDVFFGGSSACRLCAAVRSARAARCPGRGPVRKCVGVGPTQ
ncbi:MAG: type II toxin-antitoxin system HicB family antitoxin [Planctomycetota bacterium]